jgi:hypothetical protein
VIWREADLMEAAIKALLGTETWLGAGTDSGLSRSERRRISLDRLCFTY